MDQPTPQPPQEKPAHIALQVWIFISIFLISPPALILIWTLAGWDTAGKMVASGFLLLLVPLVVVMIVSLLQSAARGKFPFTFKEFCEWVAMIAGATFFIWFLWKGLTR